MDMNFLYTILMLIVLIIGSIFFIVDYLENEDYKKEELQLWEHIQAIGIFVSAIIALILLIKTVLEVL